MNNNRSFIFFTPEDECGEPGLFTMQAAGIADRESD
jgi:hypothetical protein